MVTVCVAFVNNKINIFWLLVINLLFVVYIGRTNTQKGIDIMKAKNKVIAGDYNGCKIVMSLGVVMIQKGFKHIALNKQNVNEYEVMDSETRKNAVSAVGRAFVGGVLIGPIGWLAAISAKRKGIHTIALEFEDGKKSLIEVDEKIYKSLVRALF